MERTESHVKARLSAEYAGISLDNLIRKSIDKKVFLKNKKGDSYSSSWVMDRLKHNDLRVSEKLAKCSIKL